MSIRKKRRKKVCPCCGRKLWLRDFYKDRNGHVSTYCKECVKAKKRAEYAAGRKKPDGIRMDLSTGRVYEKNGLSKRIFWSKQMCDDLKRLFPTTKNEDLAQYLGVSVSTMIRKARKLGIEKDKDWMHGIVMHHLKMAKFESDRLGKPGRFPKGVHSNPDGEFKKGRIETPEQREKRVAGMLEYNKRHPDKLKERARKAWVTRRNNQSINI